MRSHLTKLYSLQCIEVACSHDDLDQLAGHPGNAAFDRFALFGDGVAASWRDGMKKEHLGGADVDLASQPGSAAGRSAFVAGDEAGPNAKSRLTTSAAADGSYERKLEGRAPL